METMGKELSDKKGPYAVHTWYFIYVCHTQQQWHSSSTPVYIKRVSRNKLTTGSPGSDFGFIQRWSCLERLTRRSILPKFSKQKNKNKCVSFQGFGFRPQRAYNEQWTLLKYRIKYISLWGIPGTYEHLTAVQAYWHPSDAGWCWLMLRRDVRGRVKQGKMCAAEGAGANSALQNPLVVLYAGIKKSTYGVRPGEWTDPLTLSGVENWKSLKKHGRLRTITAGIRHTDCRENGLLSYCVRTTL